MVYLTQFASYSVLDGVFGMPSLDKNNYINVSTWDFDERSRVNVSASRNFIQNSQKFLTFPFSKSEHWQTYSLTTVIMPKQ